MTTTLDNFIGEKVKAYRNLNKPSFFSVKAKGDDGREIVQGYSQFLILGEVTFSGGNSAAQKKIQNGEARSVHAYAIGTLLKCEAFDVNVNGFIEVTYRPKERAGFFRVDTGEEVTSCTVCLLMNSKMYCLYPL